MTVKSVFLTYILLVVLPSYLLGAYKIEGRVNLGDEWQPKVYLALIDELSDYYRASSELIVNTGYVEADGSFIIEGNELPDEARFYRLYMMKEQNTEFDACIYLGEDDHNFVHLILDNNSSVSIWADSSFYAPFGNFILRGSKENHLMRELSRLVYPSFRFYQIKFPTELRLSERKLFDDLRTFSDTCSSTLAALAAIVNTDMEAHSVAYANFYNKFAERLEKEMPESRYTQNYMRRLRFYTGYEEQNSGWQLGILLLQSILIIALVGYIIKLRKQLSSSNSKEPPKAPQKIDLAMILTAKESEILNLISQGRSNKEIASELFIELSTVKTHINKIYNKLGVSQRKQAIERFKQGL